ncbi:sugar transferase (PEP-CTERM/EpsH1 system associated) [Janthinobacterium sp. CG_23.3]|uniref:glycosyltransferase n=1 Tax=Janthinobacterium sp. CG_23.3 TaxID=3349634 RepID=UPI0038D4A8C7
MQATIHIQHVLLSLEPGGLENGVVNVVNRLSGDAFRSSICCLQRAGDFAPRVRAGVPIREMGWRGGNDLRLAWRLARLFRETRPDVVHTRNAEAFFYGFLGAKLAGVNCIVHSEHGRAFTDRAIRFHLQRWWTAHIQAVFAVSAQLKRELVAHIGMPAQRIQVLRNGVDLERFCAGAGAGGRAALRRQLGLGDADLLVGSVGRLVAVKNHALLLTALAALARRDWVAVLVGEGPARAALEELARSLGIAGRVRFAGQRDDVAAWLAAMDVYVLSSTNEGVSNTLLEAMASGLACVASDIGGNPELIADARHGCLFASGDAAALAGHVRRLCDDAGLRRRLGAAARARCRNFPSRP